MPNEQDLRLFGEKIMKVVRGENLTKEEAKYAWKEIISNSQPDLQQGAFMAALAMKGETEKEIAGSYEAIYEMDTNKVDLSHIKPLVDNCGTGMDCLKTFNISTVSSIIATSAGVNIARHGARALTSKCGTVDVAECLGVDVECDAEMVKKSIEQSGIGLFNGMSAKIHPQALFRILSQIRFGSTLNIAGSLANPAAPKLGVRGVFSADMVTKSAETMREIGYKRALVFHGSGEKGSIDELSTMGESLIAELNENGSISVFSITPEDFSIKRASYEEIAADNTNEKAAKTIVDILTNNASEAKIKICALNTAPILYVSGLVKSLQEGFAYALDILASKKPVDTLKNWVTTQNREPNLGIKKLKALGIS